MSTKRKPVSKEAKLRAELKDLKADRDYWKDAYSNERSAKHTAEEELSTYKNQHKGRVNDRVYALEEQVHTLREIVRWQTNPKTAETPVYPNDYRPFR